MTVAASYPEFHIYDDVHIAIIVLSLVLPLVIAAVARYGLNEERQRRCGYGLAAVLIVFEVGNRVIHYQLDSLTVYNGFPMHLCDWALLAAAGALLWSRQWMYEWAYFFGMAGALQAIVSPDLIWGYPDLRYLSFFSTHTTIIIAIAYLTFVLHHRPIKGWFRRVFFYGQIYIPVAALVNWLADSNYGFLSEKPGAGSPMDHFGPWPYYIIVLELCGLASYFFWYTPFFIADRWQAKRKED